MDPRLSAWHWAVLGEVEGEEEGRGGKGEGEGEGEGGMKGVGASEMTKTVADEHTQVFDYF